MDRGICRNLRQICRKKWQKYKNTAKLGNPNTETRCTSDGQNSGALFLITKDEKWCVFAHHRRRKVVCLHWSPKKKSGVPSLITEEKWCVFTDHRRKVVCLHSSLKKKSGFFTHHWKSGVSLLITEEEKWCVFTYHQRRKVVCLHSSPRKKSGVSSLITEEEKWCLHWSPKKKSGVPSLITEEEKWFLHSSMKKVVCLHSSLKKKSGVSSLITKEETLVCLRLSLKKEQLCAFAVIKEETMVCLLLSPTTEQRCVFAITNEETMVCLLSRTVEHWFLRLSPTKENGVSSFITYDGKAVCSPITNEETVVCLRLSPTMEKCCVSACHEGRKEQKDPDIMSLKHQMMSTHLFYRYHTRNFALLDRSAGVYRLEIYRKTQ